MLRRGCGLLFHPTSLPGPHGSGSLGKFAFSFIDLLAASRQRYWQILPLGPPGYGYSPYQSPSAFAGNPILIDLDQVSQMGLLKSEDSKEPAACRKQRADFAFAERFKLSRLWKSFKCFTADSGAESPEYKDFYTRNQYWLPGYARYQALKKHFDMKPWFEWPLQYRTVEKSQELQVPGIVSERIRFEIFLQYLFDRQWTLVKRYANDRGVQIIGDLPIFVALDSADTWMHRDMFLIDRLGRPSHVAGVPPDYFSPTGQRWGNPLYRWSCLRKDGFSWWIERLTALSRWVDIVRIDHFRGFEKFWAIESSEPTAVNGRWCRGPGRSFFTAILKALPELKIIAEDLGFITPEVHKLRDTFHFPGMKVLMFALGGSPDNPYLPHNYRSENCIVYTGTHDNDTIIGWLFGISGNREQPVSDEARKALEHIRQYCGNIPEPVNWTLVRMAMASIADVAIFPVQDVMGLDSRSRMNHPGLPDGNWTWRLSSIEALESPARKLAEMTGCYSRQI